MPDPVTVMCAYSDCRTQATVAYEDTKDGVWYCHGHDWAKNMSADEIDRHEERRIRNLERALKASDDILSKIAYLCRQEMTALRKGIGDLNDEHTMIAARLVENNKVLNPEMIGVERSVPAPPPAPLYVPPAPPVPKMPRIPQAPEKVEMTQVDFDVLPLYVSSRWEGRSMVLPNSRWKDKIDGVWYLVIVDPDNCALVKHHEIIIVSEVKES